MSGMRTGCATILLSAMAVACSEPATGPAADPQLAGNGIPTDQSRGAMDIAVIGDVPYGAAATALFPTLIQSINDDPRVRRAVHVGDTKSGSTECTDAWLDFIYGSFMSFDDPLIYSPGDNEWTDCRRDNNGNWNPLERLDRIRDVYFSSPGMTLGGRGKAVMAQDGYPETQLWFESRVGFAAIHVVGSNNNLAPWTCFEPFDGACPDGASPETPAMAAGRDAEALARDAANRAWLERAFDLADAQAAAGVDAPNLTQITVDRSIEDDIVWLRLHVDPKAPGVFRWEQVTVQ